MSQLVELGWQSLALVGGGGAVISGLSAVLSQHFASKALEKQKGEITAGLESLKAALAKELETHKYSMRRQELIFDKDIEAAKAIIALRDSIQPALSPNMDWSEMCIEVALNLYDIESRLKSFGLQFGYILEKTDRDLLARLEYIAGDEKFFDSETGGPPATAIKAAEKIVEGINQLEDKLVDKVRQP